MSRKFYILFAVVFATLLVLAAIQPVLADKPVTPPGQAKQAHPVTGTNPDKPVGSTHPSEPDANSTRNNPDPDHHDNNNGQGNDPDCDDDSMGLGIPGHCKPKATPCPNCTPTATPVPPTITPVVPPTATPTDEPEDEDKPGKIFTETVEFTSTVVYTDTPFVDFNAPDKDEGCPTEIVTETVTNTVYVYVNAPAGECASCECPSAWGAMLFGIGLGMLLSAIVVLVLRLWKR